MCWLATGNGGGGLVDDEERKEERKRKKKGKLEWERGREGYLYLFFINFFFCQIQSLRIMGQVVIGPW